jgi:hypothetical protein
MTEGASRRTHLSEPRERPVSNILATDRLDIHPFPI